MSHLSVTVPKAKAKGLKIGSKVKISAVGELVGVDSFEIMESPMRKGEKNKEEAKARISINPTSVDVSMSGSRAKQTFDKEVEKMKKEE